MGIYRDLIDDLKYENNELKNELEKLKNKNAKKQYIIAVGFDYHDDIYNNMIIVDITSNKKQALKIAGKYQQQNDVDIVNVYESYKIY